MLNAPNPYMEQLALFGKPVPLTEPAKAFNLAEDVRQETLLNRSKPSVWTYAEGVARHRRLSLVEKRLSEVGRPGREGLVIFAAYSPRYEGTK